MDKYILQAGIVICFILCLFYAQAVADVELLNENELKNISGQSGFSVSPFPGFEIDIEEEESTDEKPCENQEDCEKEKEDGEGSSFSFQLPQSGLILSNISPPGSMVSNVAAPVAVFSQSPVIPEMKVVNSIPMDIVTSLPMSFGGGLF